MKKYLAEFIGTFALVFIGTGAIVLNDETGSVGHLEISLAFGMIVFLMIMIFGKISGAHINPAVTIGLYLDGSFPKRKVIGFVLSQILGGVLASYSLKYVFQMNKTLGMTQPKGSWQEAFIWEFVMTFILMIIILLIGQIKKLKLYVIALIIGSVIFLEAYIGGPISGASMNPARSIGPAFAAENLSQLWIYILAPILGSVSAIFVKKLIR